MTDKPSRQQVYTLLVEIGRKAAEIIAARAVNPGEAEPVRITLEPTLSLGDTLRRR